MESKKDDWEKFSVHLMGAIVGLAAYAFVIQMWWFWFLVPHGLMRITTAQALLMRFGGLLVTARTSRLSKPGEPIHELVRRMVLWAITAPAAFFLLGLAFKTWLPL